MLNVGGRLQTCLTGLQICCRCRECAAVGRYAGERMETRSAVLQESYSCMHYEVAGPGHYRCLKKNEAPDTSMPGAENLEVNVVY